MPTRGKIVTGALLLVYPLAVHLALVADQVSIASTVLLLVSASCIVATLAGVMGSWRDRSGFLLLFGAVAVFSLLNLMLHTRYALYLPPILINLAMLAIFANTLLSGREPLITKFHRLAINHNIDSTTTVYTRRLTWIWACLFAAMALESVVLAVIAPLAVWSLFTNFLNYVFVVTLLVGEYFYRIVRYRDQQHPSLAQFLRNLARVDWMQFSRPK